MVLLGIVAYFFPSPFLAVADFNKAFFALTMFGIGVVLETEDFRRIAQRPGVVAVGSMAQFTLMPLGAFAVSRILHLSPELTVGLVLTGAAPGAMASNVMSYVAKADTAYSVSLTAVSTLLCPLLTPMLVVLLAGREDTQFQMKFWPMTLDLLMVVILPLAAGFGVRHLFDRYVRKMLAVFPAISVTFIIFICSLVIARNRDRLGEVTGVVLAAGVILNIYGMAAGYSVGSLFRLGLLRRRTLAIEIGMQNAGLGVVLAMEHFGAESALPAAFFVFICIITASAAASYWQGNATSKSSLSKR